MIHVLFLKSHIYGTVVCFRALQKSVYLGSGMRTDVTIWRKAKLTLVSFAAVIRVVTRHATLLPTSGEWGGVTTLITAAKETKLTYAVNNL